MAKGNFGERLKRERELREVTLDEITSATRISGRFLEALENEDWEKLPGGIFNRGFVRSVARYLGLDEEVFLGEYDLAHGAPVASSNGHEENRIPSPPKWVPVAVLLGIIAIVAGLIAGGIYAWRFYAARRAAKQAAVSALRDSSGDPRTTTVELPPATTQPPAAGPVNPATDSPLDLFVSVSASTHVRVVVDGKPLFDADLSPGENRHFAAQDHFEVTAADPGVVLLELNGKAMPPLGSPGASGTMALGRNDLR